MFGFGVLRLLALVLVCVVFVPGEASAQRLSRQSRAGWIWHDSKVRHRTLSPASASGFGPVDDWFSYGPAKTVRFDPPLIYPPHDDTVRFGAVEEEIVVLSERQMRDFALVKPQDELTGPRALDAFQPFVPLPGATCTYKNLCYDMSQPPLRATLPRLAALLFGG